MQRSSNRVTVSSRVFTCLPNRNITISAHPASPLQIFCWLPFQLSVSVHECGGVLGRFRDTNFNTSLHCSSYFVKLILKYMLQMWFSNLFLLDILFLLNTCTGVFGKNVHLRKFCFKWMGHRQKELFAYKISVALEDPGFCHRCRKYFGSFASLVRPSPATKWGDVSQRSGPTLGPWKLLHF